MSEFIIKNIDQAKLKKEHENIRDRLSYLNIKLVYMPKLTQFINIMTK